MKNMTCSWKHAIIISTTVAIKFKVHTKSNEIVSSREKQSLGSLNFPYFQGWCKGVPDSQLCFSLKFLNSFISHFWDFIPMFVPNNSFELQRTAFWDGGVSRFIKHIWSWMKTGTRGQVLHSSSASLRSYRSAQRWTTSVDWVYVAGGEEELNSASSLDPLESH